VKKSALNIKRKSGGKLKGGDINMSRPAVPFTNSTPGGATGGKHPRLEAAKKMLTK